MAINPDLSINRFDITEITLGPYLLRQLRMDDEAGVSEHYNEEEIAKWLEWPYPFESHHMK